MKKIILTYAVLAAVLFSGLYFTSQKTEPEKKTVSVLQTSTGNVIKIDPEEFVAGTVSGEMPSDFEPEALKAQAVAARTYLFYKTDGGKKHENADICDNPACCCAFYTKQQLEDKKGAQWVLDGYEKIKKCVSATKGEILTYEGKPILAVFHSAAGGGRTENSEDVWQTALPYLKSVETQGEDKKQNYKTTVTIPFEEFKKRVSEKRPSANFEAAAVENPSLTQGGAVSEIKFFGESFKGVEVRSMFGLKSACFNAEQADNNVIFTVYGSGHGVGMSQYGAQSMAQNGSGYKEILSKYYSGAEIKKIY